MERRAQPGLAGDPARSSDGQSLARPVALGVIPLFGDHLRRIGQLETRFRRERAGTQPIVIPKVMDGCSSGLHLAEC